MVMTPGVGGDAAGVTAAVADNMGICGDGSEEGEVADKDEDDEDVNAPDSIGLIRYVLIESMTN